MSVVILSSLQAESPGFVYQQGNNFRRFYEKQNATITFIMSVSVFVSIGTV